MKKLHLKATVMTAAAVAALAAFPFTLTACQKNNYIVMATTAVIKNPPTNFNGSVTPDSTAPIGVDLPTLSASDITASAGSTINYLDNLVIEGEGDTEITEIYVDTSNVRLSVPGTYTAVYTVNFRGYPVSKTITVTVTPPNDGSEIQTYPSSLPGTPIQDMTVILLSGKKCSLSCTTEHYIIESNTDEKHETINGKTYLISVLKVTFNDGEVIELETAKNRVAE